MAIRLSRIDELALVTLDRSQILNLVNFELLRDLGAAFDQAAGSNWRSPAPCRSPRRTKAWFVRVQARLDLGLWRDPAPATVEADLNILAFQTAEATEGMTAFLEKRKTVFRDR